MRNNTPICNILLLGQTGAGKSSLLNYLIGESLADSRIGKPVTQSKSGFVGPYEKKIGNQQVSITDSVGLEADKSEDWFNNFNKLLIQHDVTAPLEQWYHVILYCINCAGSRIQDIDCDIIIKCIETCSSVVVVFTKADRAPEEEIGKLTSSLKNYLRERNVPRNSMPIICICNSSPKSSPPQFGKEEILSAITDAWKKTASMRLPVLIVHKLKEIITEWENIQIKDISRNINAFGEQNNELIEYLENEMGIFKNELFQSHFRQITMNLLQTYSPCTPVIQNELTINNNFIHTFKLEKKNLTGPELVGRVFASIPVGIGIGIWGLVSKSKEKERFEQAITNFADELRIECDKQQEIITGIIQKTLKTRKLKFIPLWVTIYKSLKKLWTLFIKRKK